MDEVLTPGSAEDVAEWNKREAERRRGQSLDEARQEWEASFRAANDALAAFPPERLDEDVQGWKTHVRFAVDTYHHYREHAAQVRACQRQLETKEG